VFPAITDLMANRFAGGIVEGEIPDRGGVGRAGRELGDDAHAGEARLQLGLGSVGRELLGHLHGDHGERALARGDIDPALEGDAVRGMLGADEQVARRPIRQDIAVDGLQPLRGERVVIQRREELRHLRAIDRQLDHEHGAAFGGIGEAGEVAGRHHAGRGCKLHAHAREPRRLCSKCGPARDCEQD
jgi:hypothetical protein